MALDPSVLNNLKTFADYQRADQAFQLQKALGAQQLQTGGIDAATKANIYATQVLSAATSTGDQGAYDNAKRTLAGQGIDVSTWAPDVQSGAQQAQAARLSQSPLGSLLNAGLKMDANGIALGGLTGVIPPQSGVSTVLGGGLPAAPAARTAPMPAVAPMTQPQKDQVADTLAPTDTSSPAQPVILTRQDGSTAPVPASAPVASPADAASPAAPRFNPPVQNPSETLPAYNARVQQAFEAYKTDPKVLQQQKQAETTGELSAKDTESAKKADELTKRLEMNLNAMLKLNPDVPASGFVPAGAKSYWSQAMGANGMGDQGVGAKAANQWDQINNQQVLSEIQQFIASGGSNTRINQTLDKIVQAASGIDKNDLPASREAQIKNALTEIQNKNVSGQNLAGANQPYAPVPVSTSGNQPTGLPAGATLYGISGGKSVYKLPDGSFVMEQ